jgi:hypothetical protein
MNNAHDEYKVQVDMDGKWEGTGMGPWLTLQEAVDRDAAILNRPASEIRYMRRSISAWEEVDPNDDH